MSRYDWDPDYEAERAHQAQREQSRRRLRISVAELDRREALDYGGLPGELDFDVEPDTFEVVSWDTSKLERDIWLEKRREGIGSSDAAAAMGLSPWKSAYALWFEKSRPSEVWDDNERLWWGRELEPAILKRGELNGWWQKARRHMMVRSVERPWMLANPDGLTDDAVIEAKTASAFDEWRWDAGVPDHYVIQAHWLMEVTGRELCLFPVLFNYALRLFTVNYDPEVAEVMVMAGAEMWRRIVENDPPDIDGSESSMAAVREHWLEERPGTMIELDPDEWGPKIGARPLVAQAAKEHTAQLDELKATLMETMGDHEVALLHGDPVATWRTSKSGRRIFRWKDAHNGDE